MFDIHKPYRTSYRYYKNGIDVTFYVMNEMPDSEWPDGLQGNNYYEVTVR